MPWPRGYHHYNHYYRIHRGGNMLGRLFFFLVGMYAGVVANQKYMIPKAPTPSEGWEKVKEFLEENKKEHPNLEAYEEMQDIMDKLKNLEKKYRRDPKSEDS